MNKGLCIGIFCIGCVVNWSFATDIKEPKAQEAQVTVAVMPFWGSEVDSESDLLATSARDGLIHRLVQDPDIRVVVRRRAYALSLDSEVIINDPSQASYRTPADYVVFGQLVRSKTEGGAGYNIVASIYESHSASLAKLERIKSGKDDPEALAEAFYQGIRETLIGEKLKFSYEKASAKKLMPKRVMMLPVWVLGYGEFNIEETADTLLAKTKAGLLTGWPSTDVVDAKQVLQVLDDHGLNQIGNRADAYAENVARFMGADTVVLLHLNSYPGEAGSEVWSLGMSVIDIETGIITRAGQNFYSSMENLMNGAEFAAVQLTRSDCEQTRISQPQLDLRERLNNEGNLYRKLATEIELTKYGWIELHVEKRTEITEMAVSTLVDISDSDFLELIRSSYFLAFGEPENLDVYDLSDRGEVSRLDDFTLNSAADFMHLALNSRAWTSRDAVYEGDVLRVQILIWMNQPEEALEHLKRIPSSVKKHSLLSAQISMLQRDYATALNLLERTVADNEDELILLAKAAYGASEHGKEYAALKRWALIKGYLDHREISKRTIYLMTDYEEPRARIGLIESLAGRWARGMDVAQYTLARAYYELGDRKQSIDVLRGLHKKGWFFGVLGADKKYFKEEISKLLAPHGGAEFDFITYADVNLPPVGMRYYIQPIGYSDTEALAVAVKKAQKFAGFEFVLLPPIELPLHESVYDFGKRQYHARQLIAWLVGTYDVPDDPLYISFIIDEDLRDGGWIYSNTHRFGWTIMSDYRWRLYFKDLKSGYIGRQGIAKTWLSCMQYTIRWSMEPGRIDEITNGMGWPNHVGTVQYSRGYARDVFDAAFNICWNTQKLYEAVDWGKLIAFHQNELLRYRAKNSELIELVKEALGPPRQAIKE